MIGQTQSGEILSDEKCRELLSLPVIELEERDRLEQIKDGKLLQDFAGIGSLDDKILKKDIIKEYIKNKEGSFAFEVEKLKLLAGRKKTQLETDLNDIKTEIKELNNKFTGGVSSQLEKLQATKKLRLLERELLKKDEALFYDKAQIDVETENEIAELTNEYNFKVLVSPHFKVQIFNTQKTKQEETEIENPVVEELVLDDPNTRYCIKPRW